MIIYNKKLNVLDISDTNLFDKDPRLMYDICVEAGEKKAIISEKCWRAIKERKHLVQQPNAEDILHLVRLDEVKDILNIMASTGLLEYVIPPLYHCIGIEQNKFHKTTVYKHCVSTCLALPKEYPLLRLAGLLHDVGKPHVLKIIDENITFYKHDVKGAEIAYSYGFKIGLGREAAIYLSLLVRHHMFHFTEGKGGTIKKETIRKWMNGLHNYHRDIILLRLADRIGNSAKDDRAIITKQLMKLIDVIEEVENERDIQRI